MTDLPTHNRMDFEKWFYSEEHRKKYGKDTPAYLAALEAWEEQNKKICSIAADTYNWRKDSANLKSIERKAQKDGYKSIPGVFSAAREGRTNAEHYRARIDSYKAEVKKLDEWRAAIIDGLVACHIYKREHVEGDPRKALGDLICFENEVALDTAVSSAAINLIDEWFKRLSKIELGVGLYVFYDEEHGFYFEFEDGPGIYERSQDYYPSAIEAIKAAEKLSNSGEW